MSMIGNLLRISDAKLERLHSEPESINSLIYPDPPTKSAGIFSRLFGTGQSQTISEPSISDSDMVDVDKSWHAIHFLFTGSDWDGDFPNNFLVNGGRTIGDVDVGYGPARSFTSAQVNELNEFLNNTTDDDLKSRLDFSKMKALEIYPNTWNDDGLDDEWGYIHWGLETIRTFVAETCSRSMGLIVYLN